MTNGGVWWKLTIKFCQMDKQKDHYPPKETGDKTLSLPQKNDREKGVSTRKSSLSCQS